MTSTSDITLTDMFCGAGGSSSGAVEAGAVVSIAINHWGRAIETHHRNHPNTKHVQTDLHEANPRKFPRTTGLVASPECTEHTIAKGQKKPGKNLELWEIEEPDLKEEAEERSRCMMWTPLDWAECHDYEFVILENVVDAYRWRPFEAWLKAWECLGYEYELVYFNSMFASPTPQSRDRMYFVAWKKKNRKPDLHICPRAHCNWCQRDVDAEQCWKNNGFKRGKYKQQYIYCCPLCTREVHPYYHAAASAIDWSMPAPRIGDRKKPLEEKTLQRIEDGLKRFSANPLSQSTLSSVLPFLANLNHSSLRPVIVEQQPFHTQTAYDSTGLVTPPFIIDHQREYRVRDINRALSTICAGGNHHSLVTPPTTSQWIMSYYKHGQLTSVQQAVPTVTTLDRHALVISENASPISVEDCGFRMLLPKEIQAAMAFPSDYIVTGTRKEQVKQLGNAVTPPVMRLLMERIIESFR